MSPVPRDSVTDNYLAETARMAQELGSDDFIQIPRAGWPAWDPALFGSVTHLTRAGAEKNSTELAGFLTTSKVSRLSAVRTGSRAIEPVQSQ